jgi:predicted N-acetyltransferase YhbS
VLIERALAEAKAQGHKLVFLVGDEPYYGKHGFRKVKKGQVRLPGPVDAERLLVAELSPGAFDRVSGVMQTDWD